MKVMIYFTCTAYTFFIVKNLDKYYPDKNYPDKIYPDNSQPYFSPTVND